VLNGWRKHPENPVWVHNHLGTIQMVEVPTGDNSTVQRFDWYDTRGRKRYRFETLEQARLTARRIMPPAAHPEFA
jgi:hypothetical protein